MWIIDEKGERVGPNVVGQLVIRGATVMAGYWEKPEETAKKIKPGPVPGERVLWTGDLCKMDDEGYLYFVGRMDDIIKSRGEKVAPKEIEAVLYAIKGVKEAAVVGVPDEALGQAPKAFVALEEGSTVDERELRRACQERLESFMVPKYFQIVASLPKSDNGKIDKKSLA
jgi:acyl-CoA synthetase (AMP-forming)/AMP-acid ligase II